MTPAGAVLATDDLGVRYGSTVALRSISMRVDPGELVAVIGPNGAGKSTLFRAMAGSVPHTGELVVAGRHCHHRRDRLGIAYIPQRSDIDVEFPISVRELVLGGRRRFASIGRRATPQDRSIADDCLDRVGLGDLGQRRLGTLSGGQAQRAFVARALAQEAHVLLLDEALSGVDRPGTVALLDLFASLTRTGTTMLVATHDLALARSRFDRVIALNATVVADGLPSAVLTDEALDATFGSAAVAPATA